MSKNTKVSRRQQILESLALMLETSPGNRITTAALAKQVGVSEAALYRHFPSKSKMFEGLIGDVGFGHVLQVACVVVGSCVGTAGRKRLGED